MGKYTFKIAMIVLSQLCEVVLLPFNREDVEYSEATRGPRVGFSPLESPVLAGVAKDVAVDGSGGDLAPSCRWVVGEFAEQQAPSDDVEVDPEEINRFRQRERDSDHIVLHCLRERLVRKVGNLRGAPIPGRDRGPMAVVGD